MAARTGAFAVLALVCALGAFFVNPGLGMFLALVAMLLGVVGLLRAVSPRVSGGAMSLAAIVLGAIGLVVQIVHGAIVILF
jgi:hypothetical protein